MVLKTIYLFLCIVAFSMVSGTTYAQGCSIKLHGHVEDADTKEKLNGATIEIINLKQFSVTNQNGDFEFDNLCAGEIKVRISHVHCETFDTTFNLQKSIHIDFELPHNHNVEMQNVTVLGNNKSVSKGDIQKVISEQTIIDNKGNSIAELLANINGVTMLQTGNTIAKPVINGLFGARILLINNGVRQEAQQWGNEHALEIDAFLANHISVVKGTDALKYGSDAIGGAIIVNPPALKYQPKVSGEVNAGYFTNNGLYTVSASIEQGFKKLPAFSYRIQGTIKNSANVKTPDYRLNNTATSESNFSVTTGYKKEKFEVEAFYSYFQNSIGIFQGSHIGNTTDLINAIARPKPDDIYLGQNSYKIERPSQDVNHQIGKLNSKIHTSFGQIDMQVSYQKNRRLEFDMIRSNGSNPQIDLAVTTIAENISWTHPKWSRFSGSIGINGTQQDNRISGRYLIPNYNSNTIGAYWLEKWSMHKWEVNAGLRYDYKTLETKRRPAGGSIIVNDYTFGTKAASINITYNANNQVKLFLNSSFTERAPYVNELLSNGIHHGSATFEIGNIALKPEKAFNNSIGVNYNSSDKKLRFELNAYYNHINDFIYQQPYPDSPVLTISGAFPQIRFQKANVALYGADFLSNYQFAGNWHYEQRASIIYGYNRTIQDWLINMPANRISSAINYNFEDNKRFSNSYIGIEVPTVFKQTRMPDENKFGKQDYKMPPDAYTLLHLKASTTVELFKQSFVLGITVKNILNTKYRDYLNSFRYYTDEMGRNIQFRIKYNF